MAGPGGPGFAVDTHELQTHREHIEALTDRIDRCKEAAQATEHPEAFGLLGIPLAAICAVAQQVAEIAIESASTASYDHSARIQLWQQMKNADEAEFKDLFKVED
ncbi:hypothetical protein [Amycolatopsis sp. NBC_00438]|uniref:hypothetical protein n=1 Tax=Amycolatopsis sp. NBC_00438 TaxID=2903558 RepID=UPI002E1C2DEB